MTQGTAPSTSRSRTEFAAGIAAIVIGIAVIAAVPELRHCVSLVAHGRFTELRAYIRSLGAGGFAMLLGLMVIHAVVWYPSEILTATAGYVYGFGPGLAFAAGGWFLAAMLSYALGRSVGRPVLQRLLGRRFDRLTTAIERGGIPLLLSGRFIPIVPFALLGYAAGAAHISLWRFAWTSVVGYLPLTAAVAYLGSRAQTLSASNPIVWITAGLLVALLVSEHMFRRRAAAKRQADEGPHGGSQTT
jgi:uncharacterized membrane protein YdjX (TVP38/TMEM64 family)